MQHKISTILETQSKSLRKKLLSSLTTTRSMGGGPRTFPGGLSKWQWRRLHEKKARDKEKRLLDQEKQLYQARLRCQLRAPMSEGDDPTRMTSHSPVSPREHVKALADRFVKDGAEDFWNENDGPIHAVGWPETKPDRAGMSAGGNFQQRRGYCVVNSAPERFFASGNRGNLLQNRSSFANVRVWPGNLLHNRGYYTGNFSDLGFFRVFRSNLEQMNSSDLGIFRGLGCNLLHKRDIYSGNSNNFGNVGVFTSNLGQTRGIYSGISSDLGIFRGLGCNLLHKTDIYSGKSSNLGQTRGSDLGNVRVLGCNFEQRRGYASKVMRKSSPKVTSKPRVYKRRSGGSSSDDDGDYGVVPENARWPKFKVEEDVKGRKEEERGRRGAKGFIGSGVLGKYDVKITKRRIVKELEDYAEKEEEGEGLREKVEEIKKEVMQRKMDQKAIDVNRGYRDDGEVVDNFVAGGKRFDQCRISPLTVKALTDAGYVKMSRLQEETLSLCLEGKDALVKARAGAGKTTAFLLPAIETVLKAISSNKVPRVPPIYVLVLCPIRELASQIAAEARVLLKYHDGLGVQALVGGMRFKDDLKRIETEPCEILVATPGRLLDHIESRSGLSVRLMGLKMLVVDETDHMLHLGFRSDMERIVDCLPRRRQSLVFSATVPKEVRRVSQLFLNREHTCLNSLVDLGSPETNIKVEQSYIIAPHTVHFQVVYQLLKEHITGTPDYKVIVFCTTELVATLVYKLFREMRLNVRELHTRKAQLDRSRITDEFKQSKQLILISSEARGMNYPDDVTLVVQVGIPSDREQYIRRIEKTCRDGKDGKGVLVLAPWEEEFLNEVKDLHIERSSVPHVDQELKLKMVNAMSKIDSSVKDAAYPAWLGHYISIKEMGRDKTSIVQWANEFSESIGLEKPPRLAKKRVTKLGLKYIPGVRLR